MADRFDMIMISTEPGGEVISGKLLKAGKKAVVVKKELIGGE